MGTGAARLREWAHFDAATGVVRIQTDVEQAYFFVHRTKIGSVILVASYFIGQTKCEIANVYSHGGSSCYL